MADNFIRKQREKAEEKKLGRTEHRYHVNEKTGNLDRTAETCSAKHKPRTIRLAAIPAEGKMGVKAP